MIFSFIGLLVGLALALTGSGGALLSLPLFTTLLKMSLKDATFFSLLAVIMASITSLITQYRDSKIHLAIPIALISGLSSWAAKQYKSILPDQVIIALLAAVALWGLYSVWQPKKDKPIRQPLKTTILVSVIFGLFLGVLVTFTGLGGGVILLPLYLGYFGLGQNAAVATGLLTVLISAVISFFLQLNSATPLPNSLEVGQLFLGICVAVFLIKKLTQNISAKNLLTARQVVYSGIVVYTLSTLLLRGH